jgi:hypothetical protein
MSYKKVRFILFRIEFRANRPSTPLSKIQQLTFEVGGIAKVLLDDQVGSSGLGVCQQEGADSECGFQVF